MKRVETGPIQFGDSDWPGIFIRGDDAMYYSFALREALRELEKSFNDDFAIQATVRAPLEALIKLLHMCQISPNNPSHARIIPTNGRFVTRLSESEHKEACKIYNELKDQADPYALEKTIEYFLAKEEQDD